MRYQYLICTVLVSALVAAAVCLAAHFLAHGQAPNLATINLNRVVSVNETVLASKFTAPEELKAEAKVFAYRLKTEIERLQAECGCTLLVSSAVISPSNLPDRTEDLLGRLGFSAAELAKAEVLLADRVKSLELAK